MCCPGCEIPNWFNHQIEGPSINMSLPPEWHKIDFFGFVVCAVVAKDSYSDIKTLDFLCEFNLKTNNGESQKFVWNFNEFDTGFEPVPTFSSDHLFMWYQHEDYSNCLDAIEASFDFFFGKLDFWKQENVNSYKGKVKRCGVRLLYRQDAENFCSISNQYAIEPEPSGCGAIDSDTEASNPKRIKYSNSP